MEGVGVHVKTCQSRSSAPPVRVKLDFIKNNFILVIFVDDDLNSTCPLVQTMRLQERNPLAGEKSSATDSIYHHNDNHLCSESGSVQEAVFYWPLFMGLFGGQLCRLSAYGRLHATVSASEVEFGFQYCLTAQIYSEILVQYQDCAWQKCPTEQINLNTRIRVCIIRHH